MLFICGRILVLQEDKDASSSLKFNTGFYFLCPPYSKFIGWASSLPFDARERERASMSQDTMTAALSGFLLPVYPGRQESLMFLRYHLKKLQVSLGHIPAIPLIFPFCLFSCSFFVVTCVGSMHSQVLLMKFRVFVRKMVRMLVNSGLSWRWCFILYLLIVSFAF